MPAHDPANSTALEDVSLMEPLLPPEGAMRLEDLAVDLISKANALAGQVNPVVQQSMERLFAR